MKLLVILLGINSFFSNAFEKIGEILYYSGGMVFAIQQSHKVNLVWEEQENSKEKLMT